MRRQQADDVAVRKTRHQPLGVPRRNAFHRRHAAGLYRGKIFPTGEAKAAGCFLQGFPRLQLAQRL